MATRHLNHAGRHQNHSPYRDKANRMQHPLDLRSSKRSQRPSGPISRIVGVYHMVLRRTLEHFFPDARPGSRRRSKHHRLGRVVR